MSWLKCGPVGCERKFTSWVGRNVPQIEKVHCLDIIHGSILRIPTYLL